MTFTEYARYDGVGLADLVRRKEVSPGELVESAIEVIERHDPTLNAVIHRLDESARAQAPALADGPLCGVPFLLTSHFPSDRRIPHRPLRTVLADFGGRSDAPSRRVIMANSGAPVPSQLRHAASSRIADIAYELGCSLVANWTTCVRLTALAGSAYASRISRTVPRNGWHGISSRQLGVLPLRWAVKLKRRNRLGRDPAMQAGSSAKLAVETGKKMSSEPAYTLDIGGSMPE